VLLASTKGASGEVYNFGGRAEMENIVLVQMLCTLLDARKPKADGTSYATQISFVTDRPGHDRRYAIDDTKAEKHLGFTRRHTFETGLSATVDWYLANQAWCDTVTQNIRKSA
jgi:dTDP-glucose 4,6-dehydratase